MPKPKPPKMFGVYGYKTASGTDISQVKIATSNLFLETEVINVEAMAGAIFDEIGSNDFINETSYEEVVTGTTSASNNTEVSNRNDSKNVIVSPNKSGEFSISLKSHIPDYSSVVSRAKIFDPVTTTYVYQEPKSPVYWDGDNISQIIIEVENLGKDEEIVVEFIKISDLNDGIIV
jgi:hypothetical protein